MALKLTGLGVKVYVQDGMNILDGFVVIVSIIELLIIDPDATTNSSAASSSNNGFVSIFRNLKIIRVLRTLRTLRINRLLRSLTYLFYILDVISKTIGQFIYIGILIIIFILIYSLLGT